MKVKKFYLFLITYVITAALFSLSLFVFSRLFPPSSSAFMEIGFIFVLMISLTTTAQMVFDKDEKEYSKKAIFIGNLIAWLIMTISVPLFISEARTSSMLLWSTFCLALLTILDLMRRFVVSRRKLKE